MFLLTFIPPDFTIQQSGPNGISRVEASRVGRGKPRGSMLFFGQ